MFSGANVAQRESLEINQGDSRDNKTADSVEFCNEPADDTAWVS